MFLILYGVVFVFAGWDTCADVLRRSAVFNNYGIILILTRQTWSKWFSYTLIILLQIYFP